MLQAIRDMGKSWLAKVLFVLLIASFGIWGVGDLFRGNPQQRTVATVGDTKITVAEVEIAFQNSMTEARQVFGTELTSKQARQMGLLDRSLNILIETTLFNLEAQRLGINISDEAAFLDISNRPELRDAKGNFRKDVWDQFLRRSGVTEKMLINDERQNMMRRMLIDSVTVRQVLPEMAIDSLYRAVAQKRVFDVITIKHDERPLPAAPAEDVLKKFYDDNQAQFAEPERRALTIARLTMADLEKEITVSDSDVATAYEARANDYKHPEQRDLLQVVVNKQADAEKLAKLARDKGLKAAAKELGQEVIALDRTDESSILPELYTTVFALKDGETTAAIQTDLGWHVIQQVATRPAGQTPLAEIKETLRTSLLKEKAGDSFAASANKLEDALAAGQQLEDIADSMRLRLIKTAGIDSTGITADGKKAAELPDSNLVLKPAFDLGNSEVSGVIDDRKGNYYVVRVDQVTPSQTPPLESITGQVIAAWQNEQRAKDAGVEAEKIAEALRSGKTPSSLAGGKGISFRTSKPVTLLGNSDPEIPAGSIAKIMEIKKGDVITDQDAKEHYVFRLISLIDADPKSDPIGRAEVSRAYNGQLPTELVDQYSKALRTRFPVAINESVLNSLKQQES